MNTTFNFGFQKAEADTGIPHLEIKKREPTPMLHVVPIKAGPQGLLFTVEGLIGYDWISGAVAHRLDASTPEPVSYAWIRQPTKSVFTFNEDPEQQIPFKTMRVSMVSDATTSLAKSDPAFENTRMFLQMLADEYSTGNIDITGLVKRLGEPWTESTVILLLEVLGAHRSIWMGQISRQEQENVLNRLAQIRGTAEIEKFNSTDWIQREVTASQRIESVYVLPNDFVTIA